MRRACVAMDVGRARAPLMAGQHRPERHGYYAFEICVASTNEGAYTDRPLHWGRSSLCGDWGVTIGQTPRDRSIDSRHATSRVAFTVIFQQDNFSVSCSGTHGKDGAGYPSFEMTRA